MTNLKKRLDQIERAYPTERVFAHWSDDELGAFITAGLSKIRRELWERAGTYTPTPTERQAMVQGNFFAVSDDALVWYIRSRVDDGVTAR